MLLLELKNIVKSAGDRRLFSIDNLKIYSGDHIGVVGRNGAGKTTLLRIIAGLLAPDTGKVVSHCSHAFIAQLGCAQQEAINPVIARQFKISTRYAQTMSGGEQTRYKIVAALSQDSTLLLADEPTANLDINGIELVQQKLQARQGAFIVVAHDRELLNEVCNKIWEIEDGKVIVYTGNYQQYLASKEEQQLRQNREYDRYIAEKKKLEAAAIDRRQRSVSVRKAPARMGNSEARLHKMGDQKAKANLYKAVKAIETRLNQLEVKEKPRKSPAVIFDLLTTDDLYNKVVVRAEGLTKRFGDRLLYNQTSFTIYHGQKVALVGNNGCGKTTLLDMIAINDENLYLAPKVRCGYFSQAMAELNPNQTVLTNVMGTSVYSEESIRSLLARLLFRREEVYKPVSVLSGGERTRVALARIMVSEANVLLLDEPTNYLDVLAMSALEAVLAEYKGTVLFACHDRKFINAIATHLMLFQSGKIRLFSGNYQQYLENEKDRLKNPAIENKLVLEHRLAEVLSKLSVAQDKTLVEQLDKEYRELLAQLKYQ